MPDLETGNRQLLESSSGDTAGLLYTLYINALLFAVLILFFEVVEVNIKVIISEILWCMESNM